jgi:hypothetical protein
MQQAQSSVQRRRRMRRTRRRRRISHKLLKFIKELEKEEQAKSQTIIKKEIQIRVEIKLESRITI